MRWNLWERKGFLALLMGFCIPSAKDKQLTCIHTRPRAQDLVIPEERHQLILLCCARVTEGHQRSTASSRVSASALIPVPVRETVAEEEMLMPMPKDVENLADDPQLHNPLQRSERMSTGWFGVSNRLPSLWHEVE